MVPKIDAKRSFAGDQRWPGNRIYQIESGNLPPPEILIQNLLPSKDVLSVQSAHWVHWAHWIHWVIERANHPPHNRRPKFRTITDSEPKSVRNRFLLMELRHAGSVDSQFCAASTASMVCFHILAMAPLWCDLREFLAYKFYGWRGTDRSGAHSLCVFTWRHCMPSLLRWSSDVHTPPFFIILIFAIYSSVAVCHRCNGLLAALLRLQALWYSQMNRRIPTQIWERSLSQIDWLLVREKMNLAKRQSKN